MNAGERILEAQRVNDKHILAIVRECTKKGTALFPRFHQTRWWNSLNRLEARGQVAYSKARMGYVVTFKGAV